MLTLQTPRLRLVAATVALLRAEAEGRAALAALLGADVPDDWPPESAADALPWFIQQMEAAPVQRLGWLAWYGVLRGAEGARGVLVGGAGFLGPPAGGTVETGYSVLPPFWRKGYATEMVGALAGWALAQPGVRRVVAQTGEDNVPSRRLLTRLGFRECGPGEEPGSIRFERVAGE